MRTISPAGNISDISTDAYGKRLGSLAEVFGETYQQWDIWIFVYNGGAGAWAAGDVVGRMDGQTNYTCDKLPVSSASMRAAGVAQHTITNGYYGWVLREGMGEVLADTGAITANLSLVPGNAVAGAADDRAAVTDDSFAFSTEAALATATAACRICCRG
jgi:hypothetical protein